MTKPIRYYQGCNEALLHQVPIHARTILEVGCGEGILGGRLKAQNSQMRVFGIEREHEIAVRASRRLDQVFTIDIQVEDPPLEAASLDCILFGDVLEHLINPDEVLRRFRRFLSPDAIIVCSIPNVQHHSIVQALIKGDFQYMPDGLLDATHLRFFTCSTIIKLFLDAGFEPNIVTAIQVACPNLFLAAAEPLIRHLGLDLDRTAHYLSAYQYIVKGTPIQNFNRPEDGREKERPLSFVACVSNQGTLEANLQRSPCLAKTSPHELLLMRGCSSAAEGLSRGLVQARHAFVVFLHQDVYLPRGWPTRFWRQYEQARREFTNIGVLGVYGVRCREGKVTRIGHVMDRDRMLREVPPLPATVDTLDELLLVLPKASPLRFDSTLGFHFYGADICLAAQNLGLAALVVDALCFHNSPHVGLSPDFYRSAQRFAAKWAQRLPLATSCVRINQGGRVDPI
jgi:2-polyprenyl-3-methyl-5-hydroxy-6-metoxy-1,4-benzoquinol methylase